MVDEASAFGISNFGKKIIDASRGHTRRGYANNQKSGQFWVRTPEPRNLMKSSGNQQNQKAMSGVLESSVPTTRDHKPPGLQSANPPPMTRPTEAGTPNHNERDQFCMRRRRKYRVPVEAPV